MRETASEIPILRCTMTPIRLAVLLSGNGLTLQNLHDRGEAGTLPARAVLVISNNADAFGLQRAKKMNVPGLLISRKEAGSLEEFSRRIFEECRKARVDLVVLGGFLQLVLVPEDFLGRVNTSGAHPGVLRQGLLWPPRARSGVGNGREIDGLHGVLSRTISTIMGRSFCSVRCRCSRRHAEDVVGTRVQGRVTTRIRRR